MLNGLGAIEISLGVAALAAGFTGTWSPCGLSMIETIAPSGNSGRLPVTLAALVTFVPGAIVGGVVTFGLLALAGSVLIGASAGLAYGAAAAIALAAAFADARGLPIVPQVRRQLPEHWRRLMPMPVAAGLYGVLLGLGFTTFVLSFGVWALAAIAIAIADPGVGVLIGVAFGIGRALPIAAIAPLASGRTGTRALELLTLRPRLYRGARLADALALVAVALALAGADLAGAVKGQRLEAKPGADPAVTGSALVYQGPDRGAILLEGGVETPIDGRQPALGGGFVAVSRGGHIVVLRQATLDEAFSFPAARVDAIAISSRWVAYRVRRDGDDILYARAVADDGAAAGPRTRVARARGSSQLGRPAIQGDYLFYAVAKRRQNAILRRDLARGERRTLLRADQRGLSNPAVHRGRLVYVQTTRRSQRLRIRGIGGTGRGRVIYGRGGGGKVTLWSTALDAERAYMTLVRRSGAIKIVSIAR